MAQALFYAAATWIIQQTPHTCEGLHTPQNASKVDTTSIEATMESSGFESVSASSAFWDALDADTVVISPSDVRDFNPENLLPKSDRDQASIINWLNPTPYDGDGSDYQAHLSSHLPGTGNWIFDSDIYRQWHDSKEDGILWIRGTT